MTASSCPASAACRRRIAPSVVHITSLAAQRDLFSLNVQQVPRGTGTGFVWDANGHARGILAPGGYVCKTDPDGKRIELFAGGFRNQYDIAFDQNGELFTYDADMEWDIGTPWYRPTRINQSPSGGEFGWRSGAGKWPAYYADSLPATIDIGPGSPTGTTFGTGAKFPAKYQTAHSCQETSAGRGSVRPALAHTRRSATTRGAKSPGGARTGARRRAAGQRVQTKRDAHAVRNRAPPA